MQKAPGFMGVNHTDGLQVGVDDGGAHKGHAPLFQVRRHPIRQRGAGLACLIDHLSVCEVPDVAGEAAPLPPDFQKDLCVLNGGGDFSPVPDDGLVLQQGGGLRLPVGRDPLRNEAAEGGAEGFPLVQNGLPGQARLKGLQNQQLEEFPVVVLGHAPLLVVVGDVQRVARIAPAAAADWLHIMFLP